MKRETLQHIADRLIHITCRITYLGLENIPLEGGVIIATNHNSRMDSLLLFITPNRKDITALVADKYQKYPLFKWILVTAGIIWLDRENADFGALRAAVEVLKQGVALGIAPEGTRSKNAQLQEGKPGTALVALRANVPIVPVGITGSENIFTKIFTFQRPKVTIRFGKPITLAPLLRDQREQQMQQYTDEIMCRIAALMPESYRGYYSNHPRLNELIGEPG
jgi:1-acyl-sn-glycerol-3-phosphate acyltransferase